MIRAIRAIRRLGSVVAVAVTVLVTVAPAASAHATVVSTSPADGQVLAAAPSAVSVRFDEPVQMQFGALRVFSPTGSRVDEGSPAHPTGHSDIVQVALAPNLGHGTYTVSWRVISADSHPVSGAFTFSVGAASATSVSQNTLTTGGSTAVGVLYGVARAIAFGGFALAVGATAFLLCCWPAGAASRRVLGLIGLGWGALVIATAAVIGLQGPYDGGFGLGRVFDTAVLRTTLGTRLGTALAIRLLLLGAFGTGLALVLPRLATASVRIRVAAASVGAALAVAMAATWAATDHAGAGSQVGLALPVDVVHLMAMGVWLGGLAVVVGELLRPAGADTAVLTTAIRRFSTIAGCCVGVLVVSGAYQAWRQVGTLPALPGTTYGRLLLVKVLGVALLVALGYLARVWIAHYQEPDEVAIRQLRRSTGLEVVIATGVLAITAMLVNAQPARSAYFSPVSTTAAFDTGGPNGKGTVQVFISPAKAGRDVVHIEVVAPSGEAESVPQLTATLSLPDRQLGPLPVALDGAGTPHYLGSVTIPLAGEWKLALTVRTDDIDETTVTIPVRIR